MTIKDFFEKLIIRELFPESNIVITNSEIIDRVEISKTSTAITTQVSLNCDNMELTTNIGKNIHYRLKTDDIISNLVSQRNSLMILMQNACQIQLHLPIFLQSEKSNRKQKLRNDLVD